MCLSLHLFSLSLSWFSYCQYVTTLLEVLLTGFEGVLEWWICQINHTFDILNKEHRQQDYEKFVYYVHVQQTNPN